MKVVVGKPGAQTQTPMLASTIYYATLNPYWHVGGRAGALADRQECARAGPRLPPAAGIPGDARGSRTTTRCSIPPRSIGTRSPTAAARCGSAQLPGPANSMGHVKFGFPNAYDIYLHDTPMKDAVRAGRPDDQPRLHSPGGRRAARALDAGPRSAAASSAPEQNVPLPTPVPIYVTYLTAQAHDGAAELRRRHLRPRRAGECAEVAALKVAPRTVSFRPTLRPWS